MLNKKILTVFVLVLTLAFTTKALASLTFTSNTITGTTASTIDLGTGNTLSLQTTTNAPITIGTGLVTLGGSLNVTGNVVVTGTVSAANMYDNFDNENSSFGLSFARTSTGIQNTSLGTYALSGLTTGSYNTATGSYALNQLSSGTGNTAFGRNALNNFSTGSSNTAIGSGAMLGGYPATGNANTAVGVSALSANSNGNYNTGIGYNALRANSTGSSNVALGSYAGRYETGSNAFYVDNQDRTDTAGDKAGALLYGQFNATPASQILTVNGKLGIGTTAPNAKLDINSNSFILETAQTPATSSSACAVGTIAWDTGYVYVCTATNTWKRSALTTW